MKADKQSRLVPKFRFPEFRDCEPWQQKKLGDVATLLNGRAYKKEELLESGTYKVLRVGNFFTSDHWYFSNLELDSEKYCDDGDLLYAWSASFGPRIWRGDRVIYHYHIWKVVERNGVHRQFLYGCLDRETERMQAKSANGLGMMHLTKSGIEVWECAIPADIEEQIKIACCLQSVDDLIAAEGEKLEALQQHKQGLMQQLFPQPGETVPRLRFPEFRDAEEWKETTIGNMGEVITGSTPSTSRKDFYDGEYMFVSPADISDLRFVEKTRTTLTDAGFAECRPIKENSVLFVCIGSTIGKVAQCSRPCTTNQQINSLVVSSAFFADFAYYLLDKESSRIASLAGKQAVPIINKSLFASVRVLAPALAEQQRIASSLSALDDRIAAQARRIEALKAHKQGLLQQLFPSPEGNE